MREFLKQNKTTTSSSLTSRHIQSVLSLALFVGQYLFDDDDADDDDDVERNYCINKAAKIRWLLSINNVCV
jgi:hypothetical protein